MSDEPVLSHYALKLDPMDRDGVKQFRRIVDYVTVNLDEARRLQLIDRLANSIAMLELASITGEAAFQFRSELVAAAQAIDNAVGDNRGLVGRGRVPYTN
ncbi:MAG: hypothetical protein R3D45_11135 [Rhizobiaceae bacterium]